MRDVREDEAGYFLSPQSIRNRSYKNNESGKTGLFLLPDDEGKEKKRKKISLVNTGFRSLEKAHLFSPTNNDSLN